MALTIAMAAVTQDTQRRAPHRLQRKLGLLLDQQPEGNSLLRAPDPIASLAVARPMPADASVVTTMGLGMSISLQVFWNMRERRKADHGQLRQQDDSTCEDLHEWNAHFPPGPALRNVHADLSLCRRCERLLRCLSPVRKP
jgi:hypothetical protein